MKAEVGLARLIHPMHGLRQIESLHIVHLAGQRLCSYRPFIAEITILVVRNHKQWAGKYIASLDAGEGEFAHVGGQSSHSC